MNNLRDTGTTAPNTPESVEEAIIILATWFDKSMGQLQLIDTVGLLKLWNAAACVFPGVHPDDVNPIPDVIFHNDNLPLGLPECLRDYDETSGWPLALIPIVMEMWRRYEEGIVSDEEFYCTEAAVAGITARES
jgi:hypothetical protein